MTRNIPNIEWTHLTQVLERFAEYFIQEARSNLGANHSYASGLLGDTMKPIITVTSNSYKVEIELQDYWIYVEKGRKAGKFPPVNRIKEWIMVKPVRPYPNANGKLPTVDQLTYLIGRKIANEGIDPRPFFRPAKEDAIKTFEEAIALAIDEDVASFIENHILQQEVYDKLFRML